MSESMCCGYLMVLHNEPGHEKSNDVVSEQGQHKHCKWLEAEILDLVALPMLRITAPLFSHIQNIGFYMTWLIYIQHTVYKLHSDHKFAIIHVLMFINLAITILIQK